MFGIDPDRVVAGTLRAIAFPGDVGPCHAVCVQPPQVSVIDGAGTSGCRLLHPRLGQDLFVVPASVSKHQVAVTRVVARAHPDSATPSTSAADRLHLLAANLDIDIVVGDIPPGVRCTDRIHDFVFEHVGQRLLPHAHQ